MHNDGATLARSARIPGLVLFIALAAAMALLLALYFVAKSKAFAFADIGSDTFMCFYPLQVAVSKQLHELHEITWSFNLGLGGFLGTLVDPLWLVTGWLPESWQLALRLPMFILRLLLAGGFLYAYLRLLGFDRLLAVLGGLCYSFSSYGLINAQWEVLHGTEFVQLPVYLYCLERFMRSGGRWAAVGAGIVLGLGHPLGLYMFGLLTCVYAAIKLSGMPRGEWWSAIVALLRFAGWCAVGLLLTAPLLFPEIYYLLESPRVSGGYASFQALFAALFSVNDRIAFASEIAGLLGKDLLGTGSTFGGWVNYFEAPGFYIGLLPLLCITQLLGPHANHRERVMGVAGLLLTALYFVFPAVRHSVYGFGHVGFRFSTVWISVLLLVMGLSGLRRALLSGTWRIGLYVAIGGVLVIVLAAVVGIPGVVSIEHVLRVCAFVGLYASMLLSGALATQPSRGAVPVAWLLAVCCAELLLFAVPPVVGRIAVGSDGSSIIGSYDDGTRQAVSLIRERDRSDAFFRIEKTYDSVFLDDALMQDYAGTKSYYFNGTSITRFVDHLGLPRVAASPNYVSSMAGRRGVIDLVGVKYLLTRNRSLDGAPDMTYFASAGSVDIYRNDKARGFVQFFDSIRAESAIDQMPVDQRDQALLDAAAVADPDSVAAQIAGLHNARGGQPGLVPSAEMVKTNDAALDGQVQTPHARLLLLSMPFDRGWSALLDDESLQLIRADFGLTAALIPSGKHHLTLAYAPPGRASGKWLALVVALALTCLAWLERRRLLPAVTKKTA